MVTRDEHAEMFPYLNRMAVVIRHKKKVFEWVNSVDPENIIDYDEEQNDNGSVYLLPVFPMMDEWEDALKQRYSQIF